ncbi:pyridoxal phosphate-dependent transferase [Plectosphaerella plurivora]|uniref:Pyridoxal phosphate-dependent transferase n=1 Tax=Plectosphaerella plurivora TaxID=936078 RepID=A0A9P8VD86_9PEZI|nr:pyridoxal phosphate-dependent transferase [Plectosphaerella plurivora]
MAPSSTRDLVSPEPQAQFYEDNLSSFPLYRRLVPLVASDGITHLNAGFMPPSNLVVHEAVGRFCSEALHDPSPKPAWKRDVEVLRGLLGRYIGAEPSSIAFVRDTTEGLGAFMHGLRFRPGDNVVILASEHPNQAYGWLSLRPAGLEVRLVPTPPMNAGHGRIEAADADTFAPYVDERTRAIGLSSVMFHTGQLNDVAGVCARFRPRGIHVLADLTQHVGFADVDVRRLGVSAAAFSLHKGLNTPTGIAALYMDPAVLEELDPVPPLVGYGAIAGTTEDAPLPEGPIAFHPNARRYEHANMGWVNAVAGRAFVEFYLDVMGPRNVEDHLYRLGDALRRTCKTLGVEIAGPTDRKRHASHLYVLRLHDERWLGYLRENKVVVTRLATGIRVSFGFYNNLGDVERLAEVIRAGVEDGIPLA